MTDIEIYDRAVYAYLKDVCDRVVYAPTNIAIKQISKVVEDYRDHTPWRFISFYRDPSFNIDTSRDNFVLQKFGDRLGFVKDESGEYVSTVVQSIPINLSYNIDAWAAKDVTVQELAIAVVSKLTMEDPVMFAPIEPSGKDARFHILDIEWVDNSDLESEDERGRIYRHTISFTLSANLTLTTKIRRTPFNYTDIPIVIYEGDDIDDQVCTKCDFEKLENRRGDSTEP